LKARLVIAIRSISMLTECVERTNKFRRRRNSQRRARGIQMEAPTVVNEDRHPNVKKILWKLKRRALTVEESRCQ